MNSAAAPRASVAEKDEDSDASRLVDLHVDSLLAASAPVVHDFKRNFVTASSLYTPITWTTSV